MIGGAFLAAGAAIWFVTLQWAVLRSVCAYCVAVHCCGLLAGSWAILHGRGLLPRKQRISAITVALFSVGMLIAGQLLAPPTTFRVDIADSGDAIGRRPVGHRTHCLVSSARRSVRHGIGRSADRWFTASHALLSNAQRLRLSLLPPDASGAGKNASSL